MISLKIPPPLVEDCSIAGGIFKGGGGRYGAFSVNVVTGFSAKKVRFLTRIPVQRGAAGGTRMNAGGFLIMMSAKDNQIQNSGSLYLGGFLFCITWAQ